MRKILNKGINSIRDNPWIWTIVVLLFIERVFTAYTIGITYNIASDDLSYVNSGIEFANTGRITMHGVLSAQIMPGMPVLIGVISFLFGEGKLLWFILKMVWFVMGSLTALYIYKSVIIFAPKWCGIIAALPLFAADFVWMDNIILTETPFMLFFVIMIYETFMMGKEKEDKYFWRCAVSYMIALMFKANIGIYPIFAMIYLLCLKYDFKRLIKQGIILGCMLLCFVIPWSIRNYIHYEAFIPLTWGSGNPMLLGTYQGYGYPEDEDLDYETNVTKVMSEKYARYYNDDGEVKNEYLEKYLSLEEDMLKAKYRMKEWFKSNPISMVVSYLVIKPKTMIESVFYWQEVLGVEVTSLLLMRKINLVLCALTVLSGFKLKKYRSEIFFLILTYLGNIYIYAMTFSFDRYAATLMPVRYIAMGIGCYLIIKLIGYGMETIKEFDEK